MPPSKRRPNYHRDYFRRKQQDPEWAERRREYQRKWRKDEYASNPEYREKCKEYARKRYREKADGLDNAGRT